MNSERDGGQLAAHVLAASDFVQGEVLADPALLERLSDPQSAVLPPPALAAITEEAQFMAALRRWRRAELARIAWRDLAGWASLHETLLALSLIADAAITAATAAARLVLGARHGVPRAADGAEQTLVVIAMGKLGGSELNFSSDVDLIFLFPEHGETDGRHVLSNEEYFARQGQLLIRYLDQQTDAGFVYRVDMRLRPFGDSGPLVASFASLEDYFARQGRDWERYAWVKARAVTGTDAYAGLFRTTVRPFVYRRYLDYGVFESLREMKALIEREVARRELQDNIKLGPGGIREIEFIVQSLQLVRGGSDARLQGSSLLAVLPQLAGSRLLPETAAQQLGVAYQLLRRVENCLQMRADQQTHQLPRAPDERQRLALAFGCREWDELQSRLDEQRACVSRHFEAVVFSGGNGVEARGATPAALVLTQL
jgi:glutamate-ammonia-ligase adenylyltransferase